MTALTTLTNAQLRQRADKVAALVATVLGGKRAPKCHRITRRRGHGSPDGFSVPKWAARDSHYFDYYAAHEACHAFTNDCHGPKFRAAEQAALHALGMLPVYRDGGAGPYVDALMNLTGEVLCVCSKHGGLKPAPNLFLSI